MQVGKFKRINARRAAERPDGERENRIGMTEKESEKVRKGDGGGIREAAALLVSENWSGAVAVLGTEESRRSCIPR